ncbi:MAG: glycosyltransferase [Pyrinomonadaceae bacterium]|nr:glycosyltransferase [Pyrinomonadaceae bacterium]
MIFSYSSCGRKLSKVLRQRLLDSFEGDASLYTRMKFALISHILPPSASGQAMLIYRLLKDFDPDSYCLISGPDYDIGASSYNASHALPSKYHYYPHTEFFKRGTRFGLAKWREAVNILPSVISRARHIAKIIKSEKCDAVISFTGDVLNLPAGYLASKLVDVPFYAYVCDYYSYREWENPLVRYVAQRLEPLLLRRAAGIVTLNSFMCDELRRRYGVEAVVIHNPCDLSKYEEVPPAPASKQGDEVSITYTGAIYDAHFDAFRNLLQAIKLLNRANIKLHLYTVSSPLELAAKGIAGPVVYHEQESASAMPGIQKQSDILFLPLAFTSPYPAVIRTSAPFKMGEFLAARRPILVHAPSDSFLSWYFRQHECGLVVDKSDPEKLAQAIGHILSDAELQQRLSANAWQQAQSDFSISTAQAKFAELLKLEMPSRFCELLKS